MRARDAVRAGRGFTLVELVVVIVLIGVTAVVLTPFITHTVRGYVDGARRYDGVATARSALDRMDRELREALPHSIRISGNCLQFLPILASGNYTAPPTGAVIKVINNFEPPTGDTLYATVWPAGPDALYGGTGMVRITSIAEADAGASWSVNLAAAAAFNGDSLAKRLHILGNPVSFCLLNGGLYRYTGIVTAGQPGPGDAAMGAGAILVDGIDVGASGFSVSNGSPVLNGFVVSKLTITHNNGERLMLDHLTALRNGL